jgi:hypothetical protein
VPTRPDGGRGARSGCQAVGTASLTSPSGPRPPGKWWRSMRARTERRRDAFVLFACIGRTRTNASSGGRRRGCRRRPTSRHRRGHPYPAHKTPAAGSPPAETHPAPRAPANNVTVHYRQDARAVGGGYPGIAAGARKRPPSTAAAPRNHPQIGDSAHSRGSAGAGQPAVRQRQRSGRSRAGTGSPPGGIPPPLASRPTSRRRARTDVRVGHYSSPSLPSARQAASASARSASRAGLRIRPANQWRENSCAGPARIA